MAILRKLFWLVLFLVSTLSFVVIFEKGVDNFPNNFKEQVRAFTKAVEELASGSGKKKSEP